MPTAPARRTSMSLSIASMSLSTAPTPPFTAPMSPGSMSSGSMSSGASPTLSTSELAEHEHPWPAPPPRCSACARPGRAGAVKRCHICALVVYCSPRCQRAHHALHTAVCAPPRGAPYAAAWGVRFRDAPFERECDAAPCVSTARTRGWLCPATELIGLPVYVAPADEGEYAPAKELTSVCHYLLMDPDTGFALDSWTADVRHKEMNYCAFHYHQHPLTPQTFETVVAFLKMVVEHMAGLDAAHGWVGLRGFLTREAFQLFSRMYWAEQAREGREGWEELTHALA